MKKNLLNVRKLVKKYGEFRAVKGISFEVSEGEVFALVGPNGAGKSTTLKTLATILSMTSGKVLLDGFDLVKDEYEVRERISYLPEEAGAYKNLTGIDYLRFMADLALDDRKLIAEAVEFAVEITALGKRLEDKIKTYSKGMTRKLLLARTIMSRPKLAILDEPTSGLDVINAFEIRKIIRELVNEGISVILSSHNMLEVEFLCDRMAIINEGEIIVSGTAAALKKKYKSHNLEEVFVKAVKIKN
ncbi:ABC transporter ATP-binding protein [Candidatus Peregrinibacteria bacterium]|nr:ABC transporter ATP-binding protein [Candidatus Peregrinibacteria bacterium]